MNRMRRAVPSPALAISVLALVAALSGVAVAGPSAEPSASAKNIAKKALKKAKKANKKAKSAKSSASDAQAQNRAAHDTVLAGPSLTAQPTKVAEVQLTTTTQTRILASATSTIGNDSDDAVICWLNAGGAPNNVANDISQRVFSDTPDGAFDFEALGVNGSVVKPAGTHTITLYCGISFGDPVIDRIDLLAWTASA